MRELKLARGRQRRRELGAHASTSLCACMHAISLRFTVSTSTYSLKPQSLQLLRYSAFFKPRHTIVARAQGIGI